MFTAEIKSKANEDICILIKVENHSYNYICECGEAKDLSVKECQNTNAIFISHTHIDHFVNFDTILRHQIGIQRKVVIVGPMGIIDQVQHRIKSYNWNLIEEGSITYEVREIQSLNQFRTITLEPPLWEKQNEQTINNSPIFVKKNFKVEYEILDHKTDSIAYLFKGNNKTKIKLTSEMKGGKWAGDLIRAYNTKSNNQIINYEGGNVKAKELYHLINIEKGKSLGLIMDHAANDSNHNLILRKFEACDKVLIECFYKNEDKELAIKNAHSYAAKSGEIMKRCKVKQAIPVHFSRKYKEDEIEELVKQFEFANNKP